MKEQLPSFSRQRARRLDEPFEPVPRVRRALGLVGRAEEDERVRHEPLPVDVARAAVDPVEPRAGR